VDFQYHIKIILNGPGYFITTLAKQTTHAAGRVAMVNTTISIILEGGVARHTFSIGLA